MKYLVNEPCIVANSNLSGSLELWPNGVQPATSRYTSQQLLLYATEELYQTERVIFLCRCLYKIDRSVASGLVYSSGGTQDLGN